MIVQNITLYKKPKPVATSYIAPMATEADIQAEVKRAESLGIHVGKRYMTKYQFEVLVESLGRPTKLKHLYMCNNKPSVVQCSQFNKNGCFSTQFSVDELAEMTPL